MPGCVVNRDLYDQRLDELKIETGCAELLWPDADRDGWGSDAAPSCTVDGPSATNGLDCDDDDRDVTGRTSVLCPADLGERDGVATTVSGPSEFVVVWDPTDPVPPPGANDRCGPLGWGGDLATFADAPTVVTVQEQVEARAEVWWGHVGVAWDGPTLDNGAWSWIDDADDGVIVQAFSWCNGMIPGPEDFYPLLNPDNPSHAQQINDELDTFRLALHYDPDDGWCLGVPPLEEIPSDPVLAAAGYGSGRAHFICRRETPDPEDYSGMER